MSQPPPAPPPPPGGPPPGAGWGQPGPPNQPYPGQPGFPPQGSGGSNNLVLIVGVVVLLAIVGLGAFLVLGGEDDDDDSNGQDTSSDDTSSDDTSSDDGDTSNGDNALREEYIAAFVDRAVARVEAEGDASPFTDAENECVAAAGVDAWGVDTLEAAVSPDDLRADFEADTEEFGLERDTAWGTDVWDSIQECMDFSDGLRRTFEVGAPGQDDLIDCIMNGLSDDDLEEVAIALFIEDEATYRNVLDPIEAACR